jgi:predicted amidohydrolase
MPFPARRVLRVAVVQPPRYAAAPGLMPGSAAAIAANAAAAAPLVRAAAAADARLVLLPELCPQGYTYDAARAWAGAERDGRRPAAQALGALAREAGVFLGATLLEHHAPSRRALNAFVLARPDGAMHGEASAKSAPAHFEAFVFESGVGAEDRGARVVTVEDLLPEAAAADRSVRVGVSICNDNYVAAALGALAAERPQLVLAPHCCMVPRPTLGFSATDAAAFRAMLAGAPRALSRLLGGTPVAHANFSGFWPAAERLPFLWGPLTDAQIGGAEFPGLSRVAGGGLDGDVELGAEPGFTLADVDVDAGAGAVLPSDAALHEATAPGRGALGMPWLLAATAPLNEGAGRLLYSLRASERARLGRSEGVM